MKISNVSDRLFPVSGVSRCFVDGQPKATEGYEFSFEADRSDIENIKACFPNGGVKSDATTVTIMAAFVHNELLESLRAALKESGDITAKALEGLVPSTKA